MTFTCWLALGRDKPFMACEVNRLQEPFEISLSAHVLTLFDIGKLLEEQLIDGEIAGWLSNSSAAGDETTRNRLLEVFCGKQDAPSALRWPYKEWACQLQTMNFRRFLVAIRVTTSGRSFIITHSGYMGLATRSANGDR